MFEREPGSFLLRLLFARTGRFGHRLAAYDNLDLKQLAMIGTEGPDKPVLRQRSASRLHELLQRRLVVLPGRAWASGVRKERRELAGDECAHVLDAPVKIDGRDQRFVAVGEQRLF